VSETPWTRRGGSSNHDVARRLSNIERILELMALDLTALTAAVDALVTEEGVVIAALDDLKAKLDAGGTISQTDLDALRDKVTTVGTDLQAAVDRDDPAPPPAG